MRATRNSIWYIDSGYSRYMTGEKGLFTELEMKSGGIVTFGDNGKGRVVGIGKVGQPHSTCISNVLLVEGLKHNLLSVSQFCDNHCKVVFESSGCSIVDSSNSVVVYGRRQGNVYLVDLCDIKAKCLVVSSDESTLWHRRLGHVNMNNIEKLTDKVVGLPKLRNKLDNECDPCWRGKQVRESFKP